MHFYCALFQEIMRCRVVLTVPFYITILLSATMAFPAEIAANSTMEPAASPTARSGATQTRMYAMQTRLYGTEKIYSNLTHTMTTSHDYPITVIHRLYANATSEMYTSNVQYDNASSTASMPSLSFQEITRNASQEGTSRNEAQSKTHVEEQWSTKVPELETSKDNANASTNGTVCNVFGLTAPSISISVCSSIRFAVWFNSAVSLPILIFGGTIGNALSFAVMTRPNLRKYSTSLYTSALAVVDTLFLWVIFPFFVFVATGYDILNAVLNGKLFYFLYYFGCYGSVWLAVAMSVDRLIVVYFPLKALTLCTISRTRKIIAGILIALALGFAYLIWFVDGNNVFLFGVTPNFDDMEVGYFFYEVTPLIDLITYVLLPFFILATANSMLIYTLLKSNRLGMRKFKGGSAENETDAGSDGGRPPMSKAEKQMTTVSVLICFLVIFCSLPNLAVSIVIFKFMDDMRVEQKVWVYLAANFVAILPFFNSCFNFVLYCLTARKFRAELKRMFSCLLPCKSGSESRDQQALPSAQSIQSKLTSISSTSNNYLASGAYD